MTVLPSSLALTSIADGANIVASDHRNNYAAVQTWANTVLTALSAGVAGQTLKGIGSTVSFDYPPGYQYGYGQPVSGAFTVLTTGPSDIATVTVTLPDTSNVWVEASAPYCNPGNASGDGFFMDLVMDSTLEHRSLVENPAASSNFYVPFLQRARVVAPAAGSHTFKLQATAVAHTGTVGNQAGGYGPCWIRVVKE